MKLFIFIFLILFLNCSINNYLKLIKTNNRLQNDEKEYLNFKISNLDNKNVTLILKFQTIDNFYKKH